MNQQQAAIAARRRQAFWKSNGGPAFLAVIGVAVLILIATWGYAGRKTIAVESMGITFDPVNASLLLTSTQQKSMCDYHVTQFALENQLESGKPTLTVGSFILNRHILYHENCDSTDGGVHDRSVALPSAWKAEPGTHRFDIVVRSNRNTFELTIPPRSTAGEDPGAEVRSGSLRQVSGSEVYIADALEPDNIATPTP